MSLDTGVSNCRVPAGRPFNSMLRSKPAHCPVSCPTPCEPILRGCLGIHVHQPCPCWPLVMPVHLLQVSWPKHVPEMGNLHQAGVPKSMCGGRQTQQPHVTRAASLLLWLASNPFCCWSLQPIVFNKKLAGFWQISRSHAALESQ